MIYGMYEIISKKRDGKPLTRSEIDYVVNNYVKEQIPDYQLSALLMAIYIRGLNSEELTALTEAMLKSGDTISLQQIPGQKIDKHSTGGVGDKISFIVCPLVAACGIKVPMLSGRALGHTGGTLDKLESIPGMDVFLTPKEFKTILNTTGMVVSGQTENIVPADRKLYALRDATATVSSIPLIASSIMSKKLALGTDGIVLDVKTGSGAFISDLEEARRLCQTMVEIGFRTKRKTLGLITNMDQPLGITVGNSLEIIESIEALKGRGAADIMEVAFGLGACMLLAAGIETQFNPAIDRLREAHQSGRALEVFKRFISAQGGDSNVCTDYNILAKSLYQVELTAEKKGYISAINAYEVGMAGIDIGAGRRKKDDDIDYAAGFVFNKKVGDAVAKGENILTIHANDLGNIESVKGRLNRAIKISQKPVSTPRMILYFADEKGIHDFSL